MTNQSVIAIALILIYYNVGGLATTNILRLTKGNTLPILSPECRCDSCGSKIPPLLQLPIVSFFWCRGSCRSCGCKIPTYPLLLELFVFAGMSLLSLLFRFSATGVIFSFLFYELTRILMLLIKGKRSSHFAKQYLIAVASMLPFLLSCLIVSLLYSIV